VSAQQFRHILEVISKALTDGLSGCVLKSMAPPSWLLVTIGAIRCGDEVKPSSKLKAVIYDSVRLVRLVLSEIQMSCDYESVFGTIISLKCLICSQLWKW